MIALIRYTLASLTHTQRWVAPLLVLILATAMLWIPPFTLSTVGLSLLILFPVAAWFAYATGSIETVSQEHVTVTHAGSRAHVWIAKALTALFIVVILPSASVLLGASAAGWPLIDVLLAITAVVVTATTGSALGMLVAQIAPSAPGWALLVILLAALLEVIVPHNPPVRGYIQLFAGQTVDVSAFLYVTLCSLLIAAACVTITTVTRSKTS